MNKLFQDSKDVYIFCAKLYLGEEGWNNLSKADKKKFRKMFKTSLLGIMYGLGKNSLASRIGTDVTTAQEIIDAVFKSFPTLKTYIQSQQRYPLNHEGYINTILGDKLKVVEWSYLQKARKEGNKWEEKNIEARIQRLGVNLPIQGGTSSIMASGFFNNIRMSIKENWKRPLQPIIVVHDSNTNITPVKEFFNLRPFYDTNYTEYCMNNMGDKVKICLKFDLLIGTRYELAVTANQIDVNTVEVSGSSLQLIDLYDKLMNDKEIKVECSVKREDLVPQFVTNPIERFIIENGTSMIKDLSKYTIQFKKL